MRDRISRLRHRSGRTAPESTTASVFRGPFMGDNGPQKTKLGRSWLPPFFERARCGTDESHSTSPDLPAPGFKLQRKKSFDDLNLQSAERDRYEDVLLRAEKILGTPLKSLGTPRFKLPC